jgi:hypothetical protein
MAHLRLVVVHPSQCFIVDRTCAVSDSAESGESHQRAQGEAAGSFLERIQTTVLTSLGSHPRWHDIRHAG